MAYSCAYFAISMIRWKIAQLEEKLDLACRKLTSAWRRVLEIGFGWGSFRDSRGAELLHGCDRSEPTARLSTSMLPSGSRDRTSRRARCAL